MPCADNALLAPLAGSKEFAAIRRDLAAEAPLDTWFEDGLHFFVFQLWPTDQPPSENGAAIEAPVAVFVMHPESSGPVSAVVVTPQPGGADAEIRDLAAPDSADATYLAPVPA